MAKRVKAPTHVHSLLNAPTLLAVGLDPVKGEVYIIARNGNGAPLKITKPLTVEFRAMFEAARSLLT